MKAGWRESKGKKQCRSYYNTIVQLYTARLVSVYTHQLNEMEERVKFSFENAHELRLVLLEIEKNQNDYRYYLSELDDAYLYAIGLFRRSNTAVRDTSAPRYFGEDPLPLKTENFKFDPN